MAHRGETSQANTIGENPRRERAARRVDPPPRAPSRTTVLENQVRDLTATVQQLLQAIQGGLQAPAPLNVPEPDAPVLVAPRAPGQIPTAPEGPIAEDEGHGEPQEIPEIREVEVQRRQAVNAPRVAEEARERRPANAVPRPAASHASAAQEDDEMATWVPGENSLVRPIQQADA